MATITSSSQQPPVVAEVKEEIKQPKWLTKAKVIELAKKLFSEVVFWGAVALAITGLVVVVKLAFAHPIFTIAGVVLGCIAYRSRNKVVYIATMYLSVFKNFLGIKKWCNDINPNIVLGSIPLENKQHHKTFKDKGVTDVLCLAQDFELTTTTFVSKPVTEKTWKDEGINLKRLPIVDSSPISPKALKEAVSFIDEVAKKKGKVYIHCANEGVSAAITACYLIKYQNRTANQAISDIKEKRPFVKLDVNQRGRVHEYEDMIVKLPAS